MSPQATQDLLRAERPLAFESTVARRLVHKRAIEQVLLTDAEPIAEDRFLCAGQLPRAHALFNDTPLRVYDLALLVELVRQAAELVAHRFLGVPAGRAFVFRSIDAAVEEPAALRVGPEPADVVAALDVLRRRHVGGEIAAVDLAGTLLVDGRRCARGGGSCLFLDPKDYADLRDGRTDKFDAPAPPPPPRLAPEVVGRRDARNTVIGPQAASAPGVRSHEVVVDRDHPSFFDHPLDHVPGMLLLEAMRQAAICAAVEVAGFPPQRTVATGVRASFAGFAELDEPLVCAVVGAEPPFEVRLEQGGRALGSGSVGVDVLESE